MLPPRTVADVIASLPEIPSQPLRCPEFNPSADWTSCLALGVASMREHMTDEGWQITHGLSQSGYQHCGYGLPVNETRIPILMPTLKPGTLLLQDKREWAPERQSFRDPHAKFRGVETLPQYEHTFRLTILKDAQQRPAWHATAAVEMGCHAWVIYYHPRIVSRLAPYTRRQHLIRTYHTLDPAVVPAYSPANRAGCLFSGAVSSAYPFRLRIRDAKHLPITTLQHPGYHRRGCETPEFMRILSRFKVAICTSSMYGYALRKIIEATACGCRVITDLPVDETLPHIDGNLIRIHPSIDMNALSHIILGAEASYNADAQKRYADNAVRFYDYRYVTRLLACDIAILRNTWKDTLS